MNIPFWSVPDLFTSFIAFMLSWKTRGEGSRFFLRSACCRSFFSLSRLAASAFSMRSPSSFFFFAFSSLLLAASFSSAISSGDFFGFLSPPASQEASWPSHALPQAPPRGQRARDTGVRSKGLDHTTVPAAVLPNGFGTRATDPGSSQLTHVRRRASPVQARGPVP